MMKRILIIGLIVVMGIVAPAFANLPFSTWGAANGWQGAAVYDAQGFNVVVKYAVYDNVANLGEGPWSGQIDFPPGDKYIYAYQIFNVGTPTQANDIASFTIESITHHPIDQSIMHLTSSTSDTIGGGGKVPINGSVQGQWVWTPEGYVKPGDHSWYLVFSSDRSPVKGTFSVTATPPDGNVAAPDGDSNVPEPTSIALLSLATGIFAAYRAKKTKGQ